jgi:hypothetical protein
MKNHHRRFLILLIILLSASQLSARNVPEKKHYIGMSIGISLNQIRDEQASPLKYRGNPPSFQARYSFVKSGRKHTIILNYDRSRLYSSIGHTATATYFSASYQYTRLFLHFPQQKSGIFWGGKWDIQSSVRKYHYSTRSFPERFRNHISSLNLVLSGYCHAIKKITVETAVGFPVLTYIIHSGYAYEQPEKLTGKSDSSIPDRFIPERVFKTMWLKKRKYS